MVSFRPVGVQGLKFAHCIARNGNQRNPFVSEVHGRQHDGVAECVHIAAAVRVSGYMRVDAEQQECLDLIVEAVMRAVDQNGRVVPQGAFRCFLRRFSCLRCRCERFQLWCGVAPADVFSAEIHMQHERTHPHGQNGQNTDENDPRTAETVFDFCAAGSGWFEPLPGNC